MKYSVFTVSMPEFDFEQTTKLLSSLGYDGVEWRVGKAAGAQEPEDYTFDNRYWTHNHATLALDDVALEAQKAKALCDQYGLAFVSISSNLNVSQYAEIESVAKAAASIGCPLVRIWAPAYDGSINYNEVLAQCIEDTKKILPLAQKYHVKFLFEIHMGLIIPSASAAYRLVSNFDPALVGVIYDPGNNVYEGLENMKMGIEILGPYLAHVHVKNGKWAQDASEPDGTAHFSPTLAELDQGYFDLKKLLATLKEKDYQGFLSVEDFTNRMTTEEKMTHAIEFMRRVN